MKKALFLFCFILIPNIVQAATFYLDGNITPSSCSNYDPNTRFCGSGSATCYKYLRDASNALGDNDHLYIRQGSYYYESQRLVWYHGSLMIDGTGNTVENYNGEEVWLQTGTDHIDITNSDQNNPVAMEGSNNRLKGNNYNLRIWGCVLLGGTNNVIEGCDISGGWDHESYTIPNNNAAWEDVIRFGGTNCTVRKCKLHDNFDTGSGFALGNGAILHHFRDNNTIVENCEIYNSRAEIATSKYQAASGTTQYTYRYNFIHDTGSKIAFTGAHGSTPPRNRHIYQNVFVNSGLGGWDSTIGAYFYAYNNTFYNSDGQWDWASYDNKQIFNNIWYKTGSDTRYAWYFQNATPLNNTYVNYNNFYKTGGNWRWQYGGTDTTFISTWRSASGADTDSVTTDPGFNPDDGILDGDEPGDFKRSSYPNNGRGGSWPSVMGAYITGNEIIGIQLYQGWPPAPPKNLRQQ